MMGPETSCDIPDPVCPLVSERKRKCDSVPVRVLLDGPELRPTDGTRADIALHVDVLLVGRRANVHMTLGVTGADMGTTHCWFAHFHLLGRYAST